MSVDKMAPPEKVSVDEEAVVGFEVAGGSDGFERVVRLHRLDLHHVVSSRPARP